MVTQQRMLNHDQRVLDNIERNGPFVDNVLRYVTPQLPTPTSALAVRHPACVGRAVVPINRMLDHRYAPVFYPYTVSEAIDEACSAGTRPSITVQWSDNLCHDDTTYVYSLHQQIKSASRGNQAGQMTFSVLGLLPEYAQRNNHSFLVVGNDVQGDSQDLNPQIKGRLVGPAIVELHIVLSSPLVWRVEFEVFDAGVYMLELRTTWIKRSHGVGANGTMAQRPHGWMQTIYRGIVAVNDDGEEEDVMRLCGPGDDMYRGRWLPPSSRASSYSGSNTAFLSDEHGYAEDFQQLWIWKPATCRLHLYTAAEFTQCSQRCGYTQFHIHGDSVAREQYQNLVMLLVDDGTAVDLPKTQATQQQLVAAPMDVADTYSTSSISVYFHVQNAPSLTVNGSQHVLLWAPRVANGVIGELPSFADCITEYTKQLEQQAQLCQENNQQCYFFVHPIVQQPHKAILRLHLLEQAASHDYHCPSPVSKQVTEPSIRGVMEALLVASPHMQLIRADRVTSARWDSSHDGLHYSFFCHGAQCHDAEHCRVNWSPNKCPSQSRPRYKWNWNGGVSNQLTMLWINSMCNRPCNK